MTDDAAMTRARDAGLCGAMTRAGTPCQRQAGAGTEHKGSGRCSKHTGSTPTGIVVAAREEGERIAGEMMRLAGQGSPISPGEALLTCVRMAWAQVQFFEARVAELELEEASGRRMREGMAPTGAVRDLKGDVALHLWAAELQRAMDRLAKYSKMALDAGVAQQQVDMARMHATAWAPMLKHVLDGLALDEGQMRMVPALLRSALTLAARSSG